MIELVAKTLGSLLGRLSGNGEGLRKTGYRTWAGPGSGGTALPGQD